MTTVLIDGGTSYDIDPAGRTADAVAAEVAAAVLDVADGQTFGLKVDGVVLHPGDTVGDGAVVELVEITGYEWPADKPAETVELAETGSVVDQPEPEAKKRGRAASEPDADNAQG